MRTIALAGNPNCGKTTLFNRLTGSNQHIGNWAGVTVERKEGVLLDGQALLVDLPGIYSLAAYTMEETVARDYLLDGDADVVIGLLDGTAIERGLYLILQLLETGSNMVVAVGMMDEVRASGGQIDCEMLSGLLGIPVIPIVARSGENVDFLIETAMSAEQCEARIRYLPCLEEAVTEIIGQFGSWKRKHPRYSAIRLLEGDRGEGKALWLDEDKLCRVDEIRAAFERNMGGIDGMTAVAEARYRFIDAAVRQTVVFDAPKLKKDPLTDRIDAVVLHKYLAYPIFALIMAAVFLLCFGSLGLTMKAWMENAIETLSGWLSTTLPAAGASEPLTGLLVEGVVGGIGSVVTFLPQIALIFLCLTLLEECGYLARAAFLMDLPLRHLGLTGKSFIPMMMGLGCTTPAVMASRTLENDRDRRLTILLTPYLSCGAKFPIYALFASAFFPRHQGIVVAGFYCAGIIAVIAVGLILKKGPLRGANSPFLMEFPPYRIPSLRNVRRNTGEKCGDFLKKAGTLIFLLSIVIWALQHFDPGLHFTPDPSSSIFHLAGSAIAPAFIPLGFGRPEAAIALLAGTVTKEAVVSTLGVVCAAPASGTLGEALPGLFTPLSAVSFCLFCALYAPCISALSTMRRELRSTKTMLAFATSQTTFAYFASMLVYQFGTLLMNLFNR